jgi:Secretion system C-terminal sorting domain
MKLILLFCAIVISLNSISQWTNLGEHEIGVIMTSNGTGYRHSGQWTGTPSSPGYQDNVYKTTNDWLSESVVFQTSGSNGCCIIRNWTALSDNHLFFALEESPGFEKIAVTQNGFNTTANLTYASSYDIIKLQFLNDTIGYFIASAPSRLRRYTISQGLQDVIMADSITFNNSNIEFVSPNTGFVACRNINTGLSYINKTTDYGNTWTEVLNIGLNNFTGISFPINSVGYACNNAGEVYKTINAGNTWDLLNLPSVFVINSIDFHNDSLGYIVGNGGLIYRTEDGGNTWLFEDSGVNSSLKNVEFVSSDCAYITDNNGVLLNNNALDYPNTPSLNNTCFPNPTHNNLTIVLQEDEKPYEYIIYDHIGRSVKYRKYSFQEIEFGETFEIDIREFQSGVYTVVVNVTFEESQNYPSRARLKKWKIIKIPEEY